MFEKLRQIKEFKEMQNIISKEKVSVEKSGVKITLNGKLEVEDIVLNLDLPKEEQEQILKECFNEAIRKIQISIAKKIL